MPLLSKLRSLRKQHAALKVFKESVLKNSPKGERKSKNLALTL